MSHRRLIANALALVGIVVVVGAAKPKATAEEKSAGPRTEEIRSVMAQFVGEVQALAPLASSDRAFSDTAHQKEIRRILEALARNAQALEHYKSLETAGYGVSSQVLREHVQRTAEMFRAGHKGYARSMANATIEGCIGCHSQLPSSRAPSVRLAPETIEGTPMERADVLFATQQFDEALTLYDQLIREAPAVDVDAVTGRSATEAALLRKLAIWLRIRRDPKGAAASLEQDLATSRLQGPLRERITQWVKELRTSDLLPGFDPATAGLDEVSKYARTVLATELGTASVLERPRHTASYLLLSGVLYEFLARNPAAHGAGEALFWLSKCDRTLNGTFFFSLADLYLEECIRRAPKTPIARRCYQEFKETVDFQFTGSRGTEIPAEIRARLRLLKLQAG